MSNQNFINTVYAKYFAKMLETAREFIQTEGERVGTLQNSSTLTPDFRP